MDKKKTYLDSDGFYVCGGKCGSRVCKPSKHRHDLRVLEQWHRKCFEENV